MNTIHGNLSHTAIEARVYSSGRKPLVYAPIIKSISRSRRWAPHASTSRRASQTEPLRSFQRAVFTYCFCEDLNRLNAALKGIFKADRAILSPSHLPALANSLLPARADQLESLPKRLQPSFTTRRLQTVTDSMFVVQASVCVCVGGGGRALYLHLKIEPSW